MECIQLHDTRLNWRRTRSGKSAILLAGCSVALAGASAPQSPAAPVASSTPAVLYDGLSDPVFQQPYVDIDEWRDGPVRHRYIHGGFKGTETRFSFYFPEKAAYRGRFFQHNSPIPDSENLAQKEPAGESNKIGFAIASGAYFVETNGGGKFDLGRGQTGSDPTISAYKANAAAAQYSRIVAKRVYGADTKRPYGYAYGGSGGAYRTLGEAENTTGVWDGYVPYVMGSTMAVPNVFSVRMRALRILDKKFPQIIDAVEPGGSGNPYAGLNEEEKAALREVTRMGFPPQSWFGYKTMGIHGFVAIYQVLLAIDPKYFDDFWTKPGYLGFDHPEAFAGARIQHATTIAAPISSAEAMRLGLVPPEQAGGVDTAFKANLPPSGFRLTDTPTAVQFQGGDLIVKSGAAAGERLSLNHLAGNIVVFGVANPDVIAKIKSGDQVVVDNSKFLAAQTYHWHQVPGRDFPVWDQFRKNDGTPIYPQRPFLVGPLIVKNTSGSQETGKFQGKMIVVESLWDREAFPWQADWYRKRVTQNLGARTDDNYRLWYTDHALHGDEVDQLEDQTRTIGYLGMLHQALRDISAWVEQGKAPAQSTAYRIDDGQVVVPPSASARLGIQPVVTLTVNGSVRAEVKAGTPVRFEAIAETPPGGGRIVEARWHMEGEPTFPIAGTLPGRPNQKVTVRTTYTFRKPGTYFPTIRVISQREGDANTPYARLPNLSRVRVVVR